MRQEIQCDLFQDAGNAEFGDGRSMAIDCLERMGVNEESLVIAFKILNQHYFSGKLTVIPIFLRRLGRNAAGQLSVSRACHNNLRSPQRIDISCELSDASCVVDALAREMIHQHQIEVDGTKPDNGFTFIVMAAKLESYGFKFFTPRRVSK